MKLGLFLFAALASSAYAQVPMDKDDAARPSLCKPADALGSQCHTLPLHGPPVRIAGIWSLSLVDVKDSRCPSDVDCVWEGMVTATFQLQAYSALRPIETIVLSLDPRNPGSDVWVDKMKGFRIQLEDVIPLKIGRPPMTTRYYAHIRATRVPFVEPPRPDCPAIEKPAICSYEDTEVSGANRCLAREELKKTLSQQGISYDPDAIQCMDVGP